MGAYTGATSTIGEGHAFFCLIRTRLATDGATTVREAEQVRTAKVMRGTGVGVALK